MLEAKTYVWLPLVVALAAGCSMIAGCSMQPMGAPLGARSETYQAAPTGSGHLALASWYGPGFEGRRTSDGEVFRENRLTAASRSLPMGSRVRVTNLNNGRSVVVRINDRGPYVRGRGIDLSKGAARQIGLTREGVARVRLTSLDERGRTVRSDPPLWSGRVRLRRRADERARRRTRYGSRSRRIVADPVGRWLMQLIS
jgi:rare lipoprotein A